MVEIYVVYLAVMIAGPLKYYECHCLKRVTQFCRWFQPYTLTSKGIQSSLIRYLSLLNTHLIDSLSLFFHKMTQNRSTVLSY